MKKLLKKVGFFFRNQFRKVARLIVLIYANKHYSSRRLLANELYQKHNTRYYVAFSLVDNKKLLVLNRKGFRKIKRIIGVFNPKESTTKLMDGSFYYTPDAGGNCGLSAKEAEARRVAFLNYMLLRAGLSKV